MNPLSVAADERIVNLRDLGRACRASGGTGSFSTWSGPPKVPSSSSPGSSRAFRAFDDPVQKLTMVNAILHSGSGVFPFRDQPLPAIDYHLLKHALRQGMIRVTGRIGRKLRAGDITRLPPKAKALRPRRSRAAFVELAERGRRSAARSSTTSTGLTESIVLTRRPCAPDPADRRPLPVLATPAGNSRGYGAAARAHPVLLALEDREDVKVGFRLERSRRAASRAFCLG